MQPAASTLPPARGGSSPSTLAGPVDQALEGGLCPGALSQLPELRVGPAPPPPSLGELWYWAEEWATVGVMGSWGLVAVAGLGNSS